MVTHKNGVRRLGYLSGAPRVSTRPSAETGGARAHVHGVISGFEALDWEVHRFIVGDRVPESWIEGGSSNAVHGSVFRRFAADMMRLSLGTLNRRRAIRELDADVDWVYERMGTVELLGLPFRRQGIPWILETNGISATEGKELKFTAMTKVLSHFEAKAYHACDVIVVPTEQLKQVVAREFDIDTQKVVVVPNGADTSRFDPDRCEPRLVTQGFTIGFVGAMYPWQRIDLLLNTVSKLRNLGTDVSVVLVGDGSARKNWQAESERLGLSEHVHFVGMVPADEVPGYIAGFDVAYSGYGGSLTTNTGAYGSPIKLYEYMAMGKPVISSSTPEARVVLQEGHTGFFFEDDCIESLEQAILESYRCRESLPEMGRQAREAILKDHSWTARVKNMVDEIEEVLSGRRDDCLAREPLASLDHPEVLEGCAK